MTAGKEEVVSSAKPWLDVIPPEDVASFGGGVERELSAGVRPAVVVVDMTVDFVDSSSKHGHGATGWPAVAANQKLLAAARELGLPIFYTKAYADGAHASRPDSDVRTSWKPGRDDGPVLPNDVIVDELAPEPEDIIVHKGLKASGFFATPLAMHLIHRRIDTVIVTGMSTSGCVRATVVDGLQYNFHVIVPFECVADRSQISHKVSLFDMHMKYASVVSLDETLEYLASIPQLVVS